MTVILKEFQEDCFGLFKKFKNTELGRQLSSVLLDSYLFIRISHNSHCLSGVNLLKILLLGEIKQPFESLIRFWHTYYLHLKWHNSVWVLALQCFQPNNWHEVSSTGAQPSTTIPVHVPIIQKYMCTHVSTKTSTDIIILTYSLLIHKKRWFTQC